MPVNFCSGNGAIEVQRGVRFENRRKYVILCGIWGESSCFNLIALNRKGVFTL